MSATAASAMSLIVPKVYFGARGVGVAGNLMNVGQ
jgi:hypothetical protein